MNIKLRRLIAELIGNASLSPGDRVVDYGCADAPYAGLLPSGAIYVGADLADNPYADIVFREDGSVPLPDGTADVVMSTQVLEHVPDPAGYLCECARLLRPGGSLVLTTHGIMFRHPDPEDYWRWTNDGLARIVTQAGLEVVELRGVLTLVAAALLLIEWGTIFRLPKLLYRPSIVVFQGLIALADRLGSEENRMYNGFVLGVRAIRPISN